MHVYTFNFSHVSGIRNSETTTVAAKQVRETEQSLLPGQFYVVTY